MFADPVLSAASGKSRIVSYYWFCSFFNHVVFILLLCSRCKALGFTRETLSFMIRLSGEIVASHRPHWHVFSCKCEALVAAVVRIPNTYVTFVHGCTVPLWVGNIEM